jgi:hypothetical protein
LIFQPPAWFARTTIATEFAGYRVAQGPDELFGVGFRARRGVEHGEVTHAEPPRPAVRLQQVADVFSRVSGGGGDHDDARMVASRQPAELTADVVLRGTAPHEQQ